MWSCINKSCCTSHPVREAKLAPVSGSIRRPISTTSQFFPNIALLLRPYRSASEHSQVSWYYVKVEELCILQRKDKQPFTCSRCMPIWSCKLYKLRHFVLIMERSQTNLQTVNSLYSFIRRFFDRLAHISCLVPSLIGNSEVNSQGQLVLKNLPHTKPNSETYQLINNDCKKLKELL